MSPKRKALKCEAIPNEFGRFRVESQSRDLMHLVDLCQDDGHGACTCENDEFRDTKCVHINLAWSVFVRNYLRPLVASQVNGPTPAFEALLQELNVTDQTAP